MEVCTSDSLVKNVRKVDSCALDALHELPEFHSSNSNCDNGSSFQFESGTALSEETETVYFVLESSVESGQKAANFNSSSGTLSQLQNEKCSANSLASTNKPETKLSQNVGNDNCAGKSRTGVTKCLESNCDFVCSRIPQLRSHLEDVHGIQQDRKIFAFASEDDFKAWLSAVEREACSTFMRRRGWQMNKSGSMTACFYCNRGGSYTSKATKKQIKAQGSCKIGVECTASMKVTMFKFNEDKSVVSHVEVEAYLQHYGHNLDLTHTRLTKTAKEDIARKLSSGISRSKILDDVRGTLDAATSPHRLHLLSLQDLYNIEKKEGIKAKKIRSNGDEGTTVQAWIEKMQQSEDNPVLLIKYQQEKAKQTYSCLGDDDFILILQTPLQAMMLRRYGPHQCICMDITKGEQPPGGTKVTNDPSFYLMSLQIVVPVLNDREEIFPVAWFVSNRKDKPVVEIFLSQIKNNLSDLTLTPSYLFLPSIGVTSGCDWYQVWISIFGPGPRKLLCSWHIVDEFKHRIQRSAVLAKTSTNAEESRRRLSNLLTVLRSTSVDDFLVLLQGFISDLDQNKSTSHYANFFKTNYAGQPEVWSRAYRSEGHVQTEAKFESYHFKVARHIYHEGFKRKQLDVLIKILMRNSRDRALHRLRQSYKLTSDVSIRRKTMANHWNSVSLPISFVSPHEDSRTWSVMSVVDRVRALERSTKSGEPIMLKQVAVEYIVKCAVIDRCSARLMCSYRCEDCGVCSHHLTCTCQGDQKIVGTADRLSVMCEHCHLVVRYLNENSRTVEALMRETKKENDISQQVVVIVVNDDDTATQENSGNEPSEMEVIEVSKVRSDSTCNLESDCSILKSPPSFPTRTTEIEQESVESCERSTEDVDELAHSKFPQSPRQSCRFRFKTARNNEDFLYPEQTVSKRTNSSKTTEKCKRSKQ